MPDGGFKGMTPDPDSLLQMERFACFDPEEWRKLRGVGEKCERCGGYVFKGSWPWCKGDPEDHAR